MFNNCPKQIIKIGKSYQYRIQLIRFEKDFAFLRITDPYIMSPFPHCLDSCVRSYSYVKRLFERIDIRYKI